MLLEMLLVLRQDRDCGTLVLSSGDSSPSPSWCQLPLSRQTRCRGLCLHGAVSPARGSALLGGPAASESTAGRRQQTAFLLVVLILLIRLVVLILLFLLIPPREPLSHQLHFSGPTQKPPCPELLWWASTEVMRNRHLPNTGQSPLFFKEAPGFLFACYIELQSRRCPVSFS